MDKIWSSIVRNSLWAGIFGILLIILGFFIYKKQLMKQLPAWMALVLCLVQCLGRGSAAALYDLCYKVPSDAHKVIHTISLVDNVTEIVTAIIISVVLIWCIKRLSRIQTLNNKT